MDTKRTINRFFASVAAFIFIIVAGLSCTLIQHTSCVDDLDCTGELECNVPLTPTCVMTALSTGVCACR
jgi:hypothetical protein